MKLLWFFPFALLPTETYTTVSYYHTTTSIKEFISNPITQVNEERVLQDDAPIHTPTTLYWCERKQAVIGSTSKLIGITCHHSVDETTVETYALCDMTYPNKEVQRLGIGSHHNLITFEVSCQTK